jgi:hypothetical protein
MSTKLVLPSVSELQEKLDAEVSMFCSHFKLSTYSHSYGKWVANIEGCKLEVVAKFEKSPYIRIEGNQITLPIYGEELSEVIEANWEFIKNRFPQR